jgi:hypothetical protein
MILRTALGGLTLTVGLLHGGTGVAQEAEYDRFFSVLAVEYRAYREVERTPYPAHTHEQHPGFDQGTGYRLDPPNEDDEWYVRAYAWSPSTLVVEEGDRVRLEFFGINGDHHPVEIEGYDLEFEVKRGEFTHVDFEADKAGLFLIKSIGRMPSMAAQFVVLPRP